MQQPKIIENEKDFCCSKGHKLPVVTIALDEKLSRNQRLLCTECLENIDIEGKAVGLKKMIQLIEENQVKKMENVENIKTNQIKLIESLHSIVDQMKSLELEFIILKSNQTDSNIYIQEIWKTNLCWTSKFNPKLEQFNQFDAYNQCQQLLLTVELGSHKSTQNDQQQQINIENINQEIQSVNTKTNIPPSQTNQSSNQLNVKPFNYLPIQEVTTLNFMQKSKQFISGSLDKSIIIWKQNQNKQWSYQQKLNRHKGFIQCLIINTNEDLIVSGSQDCTLKFWINKNEWLCQQTINDHSKEVYGLSLNQQQNRVVSCGYDQYILIIEQSEQNKEWKVIQNITIDNYGFRVCFIDNNMFTSTPIMNNNNKYFTITRDISIKSGSDMYASFPQQYINQISILVSKNGEYVNLIRKKQNEEILTEQYIDFGIDSLHGTMSNDGEYLITWDYQSKQIQIRRYQEL
ncbi:unnamed protein product [Paramecium pentaurelia]|uniref:WD40-repeat-containing domain n=1 Tax=Paramecium pentaurelia TaxID=43138 RepID=A0A8S1YL03_9CILI|nr:unnamed protein product [Paramecium pentaurelia]